MLGFQIILIASCLLVASVHAGTRTALPGEEARALDLWDRYCAGGKEGGKESNIFIHCKHPLEQQTKTLGTSIQAQTRDGGKPTEQYIFVQPPRIHFNHELEIRGGAALEPKTIVYVKPAKTSHTYEAELNVPENEHKKPELVFLSSGGSSGGSRGQGVEVSQASPPVITFEETKQLAKREIEDQFKPVYSKSYSSVVSVASSRKRRDSW